MSKYIIKLNNINNNYVNNNLVGGNNDRMFVVINKSLNIVERVFESEYQKNIANYEKIDDKFKDLDFETIDKNMIILLKKNLKDTIKYIDTKGHKNKFYHISIRPIGEIYDDSLYGNLMGGMSSVYYNPTGLWISQGSEWMKFINETHYRWSFATHIYEIETNDKTVLNISNLDEFKKFIKKYKNPIEKLTIDNVIDWKRLQNDYDGLIISPYLGNKIWGQYANELAIIYDRGFNYSKGPGPKKLFNDYIKNLIGDKWKDNIYFLAEWYRHWEIGSGVIWKKRGITNITLVKKLDTFDSLLE